MTEPMWWTQTAGPRPASPPPPRRAPRRAGAGTFFVVMGLFLALAVAADRGADLFAERAIGQALQREQGLDSAPQVAIAGFPFLTQAVAGRYTEVTVDAAEVPTGEGLTVDSVQVRLSGVRAGLGDLSAGRTKTLQAERMQLRAQVGYPALDDAVARRLESDRLTAQFGYAGPGLLSVRGVARTPVGRLPIRGQVKVQAMDDGLKLDYVAGSADVPKVVDTQLRDLLSLTVPVPPTVGGVRPGGVEVEPGGLVLTGEATEFSLGSLG